MPRRTIPNSYLLMLYDYLEGRDLNAEKILGMTKPKVDIQGRDTVTIDTWITLLDRAAKTLQDPLFGLHLGQSINHRHFGVLGYLCSTQSNLGEALLRFQHYQRLVYDVTPMTLRYGKDYVDLVWDDDHGRHGPLADESGITAVIQHTRNLCGERLCPLAIQFVNPKPKQIAPYQAYFGCPVTFDALESYIRIPADSLAQPLQNADPLMQSMMEAQADKLLAALAQESTLVDQVRKHISHLLHTGAPNCSTVASKMALSNRSLQRFLTAEDTCFRDELAIVRQQLAERYLRDSSLHIADIAQLLGYSEQSAFTRSFRRWLDCSPQQYRLNSKN